MNANGSHPALQLLVLGLTANVIALPLNLILVYFSAKLAEGLRRNGNISAWLHKSLGALFIALGLRLAVEKI